MVDYWRAASPGQDLRSDEAEFPPRAVTRERLVTTTKLIKIALIFSYMSILWLKFWF
jgi:hypothetical protein